MWYSLLDVSLGVIFIAHVLQAIEAAYMYGTIHGPQHTQVFRLDCTSNITKMVHVATNDLPDDVTYMLLDDKSAKFGGEDLLEFSRSKHVGLVFLRLQYTIWESEYQRIVMRYFPFIGKFGLKNQWVIERIYRMTAEKNKNVKIIIATAATVPKRNLLDIQNLEPFNNLEDENKSMYQINPKSLKTEANSIEDEEVQDDEASNPEAT